MLALSGLTFQVFLSVRNAQDLKTEMLIDQSPGCMSDDGPTI